MTCRTLGPLASNWTQDTQACPKTKTCLWRWVYHATPSYTMLYTHTYYLGWCLSWSLLWLVNGMVLHWVDPQKKSLHLKFRKIGGVEYPDLLDWTPVDLGGLTPRVVMSSWPNDKSGALPPIPSPADHISRKAMGLVANFNIFKGPLKVVFHMKGLYKRSIAPFFEVPPSEGRSCKWDLIWATYALWVVFSKWAWMHHSWYVSPFCILRQNVWVYFPGTWA